ncbi:hypothetical protein JOB18_000793 [Solea senegalensis]|uniref:Uncharacterized protein n=1 Tax=Solea senegalensis TaxID=28829 RepID=A0AAV6S497_SOLSE|nr:hypothetical protein JOB18_000793 [Solea senegalensis]
MLRAFENNRAKTLWDVKFQTDEQLLLNQSHLVMFDKMRYTYHTVVKVSHRYLTPILWINSQRVRVMRLVTYEEQLNKKLYSVHHRLLVGRMLTASRDSDTVRKTERTGSCVLTD